MKSNKEIVNNSLGWENMEHIGKVKYIAAPLKWAKPILKKDEIYPATELSTEELINVELDIQPQSFYTDTIDKFEIVDDPDGKLKTLFSKKESKE